MQGHGHVVKVVVVWLVPRLKIPLGNVLEAIPTCRRSSLWQEGLSSGVVSPAHGALWGGSTTAGRFGCDGRVWVPGSWPPLPSPLLIRRPWLGDFMRKPGGGWDRGQPAQECPLRPRRARALPTDVSPGEESDQLPPLKHLLLVLKVGEASRGAAHQLETCSNEGGIPQLTCLAHAGTEAAPSAQPGGPRRTRPRRDGEASGTRAMWQLTWDELVLPEKVQVPIQVGEVVAQALPE